MKDTSAVKGATKVVGKAVAKEIKFNLSKETKGAVAFLAEGLENSNIYFKKTELADLGLEGVQSFTMTLKVEG